MKRGFNQALKYSFFLLKFRARSKDEIICRLRKKKYESSLIEQIINYLEKNNYINDKNFTKSFIASSLDKGWGPRRIEFNLKKLGIPYDLRKYALKQQDIYKEKIRELIQRKLMLYRDKYPNLASKKIWQKIARHIAARGFDYEDIFKELEDFDLNEDK